MSRVHSATVIAKTPSLKGCLSSVIRTWELNEGSPDWALGASNQECGLPWSPLFTPVNQSGHPARIA
jgi:hypothetical protein